MWMLQRGRSTDTAESNGAENQPPNQSPQWERVSAVLSPSTSTVEDAQTQTKRHACTNCGRAVAARIVGRNRAMSSASSHSSLAGTVRGASFTASFTTSFASDATTASCSSVEPDELLDDAELDESSMCDCGEDGCQCLCSAQQGSGPADVSFFALPSNIRELAGVEDPMPGRRFCGPECRWSHQVKEELELGKLVKRKLLKKQREQVEAEISAKEATSADDSYRIQGSA